MRGWISVKDRLPEIPEGHYAVRVIVRIVDDVCASGNSVREGMYVPEKGFGDLQFCEECCGGVNPLTGEKDMFTPYEALGDHVSHWMPLPEPPHE